MLEEPNPSDSFRTLIEQAIEDALTGGYGAIEMEATGDPERPAMLWAVDGASIKVKRELEDGWFQHVEMPLPALLTIQSGISKLRYATLMGIKKAKSKEIKRLTAAELGAPPAASIEMARIYVPGRAKQAQIFEAQHQLAGRFGHIGRRQDFRRRLDLELRRPARIDDEASVHHRVDLHGVEQLVDEAVTDVGADEVRPAQGECRRRGIDGHDALDAASRQLRCARCSEPTATMRSMQRANGYRCRRVGRRAFGRYPPGGRRTRGLSPAGLFGARCGRFLP